MPVFKNHPLLVAEIDPAEGSVAELFHENTKLWPNPVVAPDLVPVSQVSVEEGLALSRSHKTYATRHHVELSIDSQQPSMAFDEVVRTRRTIRTFDERLMTFSELGALLDLTNGITGVELVPGGGEIALRAAPSAGALYPIELYLAVRRVDGLAAGLYHYEPHSLSLALLRSGDPTESVAKVCCGSPLAEAASVTVFFSGVFDRTLRKYGDRGYRYVLLDAGHVAQNLCLAATSKALAVTTTCGFFDDQANELLGLGGLDESVLYVAFVGPQPV